METKQLKQSKYSQNRNQNGSKPNISRDILEINVKNNREYMSSEDEKYNQSESKNYLKMRNMDLSSFENIKEENDECESNPPSDLPRPSNFNNTEQRGLSLMNKFDNPRSSASSNNNYNNMRLCSSSYDSNSNMSDKFNNRHHSSTENILGNLTQKEPRVHEMNTYIEQPGFMHPTENAIICVQETKFLSQEPTTQNQNCENELSKDINIIGKAARSRNVVDPMKASLHSSESEQNLMKNQPNELDDKLKRVKKRKLDTKFKETKTNTMFGSKGETFRNTDVGDGSSIFNTARDPSRLKKVSSSSSEKLDSKVIERRKIKRTEHTRHPSLVEEVKFAAKPPKVMGFFTQDEIPSKLSRNEGLKNAKTSTIHVFDDLESGSNNVTSSECCPIPENPQNLKSYEPMENQMFNTLDSQKQRELSGTQDLKLTDYSKSKQNLTLDAKSNKSNKKASSKGVTKLSMNNQHSRNNQFMIASEDSYNPQFELDEMDFRESKLDNRSELFDKISDAAKTFRNLRNQLITKNNTEKIGIQNQIINQSRNVNNLGLQINSFSPKAGTQETPIFERKQRGDNRQGSATTLYVETVSNKVTDTRNDSKGTSMASDRQHNPDAKVTMNRIDKSSKKSLTLEEAKISARDVKDEFKVSKSKKKLKHGSIRKFKNYKRGKRKRANEIIKREQEESDGTILQSAPFDMTDQDDFESQNHEYHEIKAAQQMRRINVKHNLSKVEEEDCDDTINESKVHNTLLTKNILSSEYKFGNAQPENRSIMRTNMLSKPSEDMEIYFEQDNEAD